MALPVPPAGAERPEFTIAALARHIRAGDLSPVALTRGCIDRIAALDGRIASFNCVAAEAALSEARRAEAEIAGGGWRGPMHGIPVGIKDLIDVAGLPTTAQAAHRRDHLARRDAAAVAMLRRAGAVILGKTATAEYAVGGTRLDGPWPPVRNPWNLSRDPSSSSSGSAAAVAAGFVPGALGTETAGSIRAPAAWCGTAGLKPTDGLVSRAGVLPVSRTMDCLGPLAWTVEDCTLMLSAMISQDAADRALPGFRAPDPDRLTGGIAGLRIGVPRHLYEDHPQLHPAVAAGMERALALLPQLGAGLQTLRIADHALYSRTAKAITWPEEYAEHGAELRAHPDRFGATTRSRLQDGRAFSAAEYILALRLRQELIRALDETMRGVDLLILPTMLTPAQPLGYEHQPGAIDTSLTRPFNLTGSPALTLCSGHDSDDLPVAVQLIGRRFEDDLLLAAGHALETALDTRNRRPVDAFPQGGGQ
ncbi:amidase [Frigidibacter sp. ROC022]|uniref:amidase n=1 Tax=Frigidibacter sp. ROC022 TaxID=2971796 RepID=UPI00215B0EB6|nr:amidase [Frigidibacter sp. ROC022]MCR8723714.1 amidase [Frigidibacter sp. ROC022]